MADVGSNAYGAVAHNGFSFLMASTKDHKLHKKNYRLYSNKILTVLTLRSAEMFCGTSTADGRTIVAPILPKKFCNSEALTKPGRCRISSINCSMPKP